jgi:hypothetical protein
VEKRIALPPWVFGLKPIISLKPPPDELERLKDLLVEKLVQGRRHDILGFPPCALRREDSGRL